ncbi:prepilin peptidase [Candidatus Dojkabacteria bacterium]|uniref:Prepilin peptidase n=1 Tax=Candidatus Dojkabacteria bacterium TaxID=2099670 RepID=A0A5C7J852_9BACT|nr:MAG: prepilin peptidase [Candidatus Dojkabacteria bacterium]
MVFELLSLFIFGLIIGSFLNVLVLRSETEETLGGRSHCPRCQAMIHWYDNIPLLSFLFLRGRCRACQAPISWQYPFVELGTGLSFTLMGAVFERGVATFEHLTILAALLFTTSLLIAIVVTDFRTMEIPLVFLWLSVLGAGAAMVLLPWLFHSAATPLWGASSVHHLIGGLVAAIFFAVLVFGSRETWMGRGDIWLAATIGLLVGIKYLLLTLTLSFLLGAVIGVGLLFFGGKQLKSQIPFAPFLVFGFFLMTLLTWIQPWWLSFVLLPIE